jgi:IstB-like ATP binding protein
MLPARNVTPSGTHQQLMESLCPQIIENYSPPTASAMSKPSLAVGQAAIQQNYRVLYRETHVLLDGLAEAVADGTRKEFMESLTTVPLLIIDDFGMRSCR